jgi:hypothetical protein
VRYICAPLDNKPACLLLATSLLLLLLSLPLLLLLLLPQSYGVSWRPCGVDSLFLPGTQKFEVERLGYR